MPTETLPLTDDELAAGLVLLDPLFFRLYFFADDLGLDPSPEQKFMWVDESPRVLFCTGRKIAKTIHIEATVIQHGIIRDGDGIEECLCITPSDVHMTPILDRVFGRIERVPLFTLLVSDMRRGDNTIIDFRSGVRWYFRIEGLSGTDRNVVGLRAKKVVEDEAAFANPRVFNSMLQTALPDATWLVAGVPNGVRQSTLYELDQTGRGSRWSKHNYPTFINPLYAGDDKRQQLIDDYGGEATQGYVTQVLGQWGEEMISSFPPGSFTWHKEPAFYKTISAPTRTDMDNLPALLAVPHVNCHQFAVGLDHGFSPDPTEAFFAIRPTSDDVWKVYYRLQLKRVSVEDQAEMIGFVLAHFFSGQFVGLSTDKIDLVHALQKRDSQRSQRYMWSSPGSATAVIVKQAQAENYSVYHALDDAERDKEIANVPNKIFYTNLLKGWLLNAAIPLPGRKLYLMEDGEVEGQLVATIEKKTATGHIQYFGPPDPNIRGGQLDHTRESLAYLCDAINRGLALDEEGASEEELIAAMGWIGPADNSWQAPW